MLCPASGAEGSTAALVSAAAGGHPTLCAFLVEKRADVNGAGPGGWTALRAAANAGHLNHCGAICPEWEHCHSKWLENLHKL